MPIEEALQLYRQISARWTTPYASTNKKDFRSTGSQGLEGNTQAIRTAKARGQQGSGGVEGNARSVMQKLATSDRLAI